LDFGSGTGAHGPVDLTETTAADGVSGTFTMVLHYERHFHHGH
jgi:hypothetical protein